MKASAVVTCCSANEAYLNEVLPANTHAKIRLVHHGIDLQGIHPADPQGYPPQGAVPLILTAGRLVKKKGFPDLVQALALLKQDGIRFQCRIYGDGPLQTELAAQIVQLGLQGEVCLAGAYTQSQIMEIFSKAALFALTPIIPPDGDRDGIPNVLIEAMACGVPVVSTAVAGIPELVRHGQNGFLSTAHDVAEIKVGMQTLLCDEVLRHRMGAAARQTVCAEFDQRVSAKALMELFSATT
jgi:glycosyltransferase involved in cell wall biosynthesis